MRILGVRKQTGQKRRFCCCSTMAHGNDIIRKRNWKETDVKSNWIFHCSEAEIRLGAWALLCKWYGNYFDSNEWPFMKCIFPVLCIYTQKNNRKKITQIIEMLSRIKIIQDTTKCIYIGMKLKWAPRKVAHENKSFRIRIRFFPFRLERWFVK